MNKRTKKIICTNFANGKKHDFALFKDSKIKILPSITIITDSGYQGLQNIHPNTIMPKKKSKKNPLTKEEKKQNRECSRQRILSENTFSLIKRFKIVADRYRNRRKRFDLRFNLLAGIHNFELDL